MAKKETNLNQQIKDMEDLQRAQAMQRGAARNPSLIKPKISFDVWHMQRAKQIPNQHMKEILWADFKARGLSDKETAADYDKALVKYGVKLD